MKRNIYGTVKSCIEEVCGVPVEVKPETTIGGLGFDSLDRIELVMKLEKVFHIQIKDKEFMGLPGFTTIQDIVGLLRKKGVEDTEITLIDFGGAIRALKEGKKVTRVGWNGRNMFLWLKPAATIKSSWCKDPMLKALADENGGELSALGTICMFTAKKQVLTGWLASQTDMLEEDWYELKDM